ncbi:speckle-type POZ protein B-like [Leptopilina heterotoma]|uniref:speckle-type POZ protein B-like n=1 Tax=Leptopilina heterotoma TaxID=63436 RepID=UPI001CA82800|nr:speckle-type POZ protein B-like [Leptopilina heterotoma]XP_043479771.1 speckle-type POZ protein B-like [Leptopilina heterotoma]
MDKDTESHISMFDETSATKSYTSELKSHHYELNWTIKDFELVCKSVLLIKSPKFPSKSLTDLQWFLQFNPTELKANNTNDFIVFLKNTKNSTERINVRISFINSITAVYSLITPRIISSTNAKWMVNGSEFRQKLGKAISKNVLVKCKLSVFDSLTTIEEEPPVKRRKCNDPMENMKSLLGNENFKDVRFKVEDKEFTAHKAILAIRSPVFAAMFNSKMSEELTSIVQIKDIKPTIFQQMLNFIYNVEIKDLDEVALDLFCVAEKYQLEELKTNCINSLCKNLSAKTVFDTLEMADLYSLPEVRSECLKLLITEWNVISETKEFKNLIQNRPYLTVEIVNMRQTLDKKENAESNKSLNLPFAFRN